VARAIWKGTISFGLVNAPVSMYSAIDEQDLHFQLVHRKDMSPIGYQKVCKKEDKPVDADEIAKAYELDDGRLVLLEDEDFEAAETDAYHEIRILDFVPHEQIDPIYFERTYYLAPADPAAEHVYALLAEAMSASGLSGISSFIFRDREQLGCLRVMDGVLALEKMFFADEIRDAADHRPKKQRLSDSELEMARELIDRMAGDFDPKKYHDTYREKLLDVIKLKARGKAVKPPERREEERAPDLIEALRASLAEGRTTRGSNGNGSRSRSGGLEDMSVDELRERAAKRNVKGRSKMSKRDLIKALR
jgi:DNA end-binding protein Ku